MGWNCTIGAPLRQRVVMICHIPKKYTSAFGMACGLLFLGFISDTLSTLAAGKGALIVDFNPLLNLDLLTWHVFVFS